MVRVKVSCSEGVASHTGPRVMSASPQGDVGSVDRGKAKWGQAPFILPFPVLADSM